MRPGVAGAGPTSLGWRSDASGGGFDRRRSGGREGNNMTSAPDGSGPPESSDEQVPAAADGPQVPVPRVEFLRATRKIMRGSRALITGGDAGLGRVIAVGLAREGVDVAIACAPGEPAE